MEPTATLTESQRLRCYTIHTPVNIEHKLFPSLDAATTAFIPYLPRKQGWTSARRIVDRERDGIQRRFEVVSVINSKGKKVNGLTVYETPPIERGYIDPQPAPCLFCLQAWHPGDCKVQS